MLKQQLHCKSMLSRKLMKFGTDLDIDKNFNIFVILKKKILEFEFL